MKKMIKWFLIFIIVLILYIILAGALPYAYQPKIDEEYVQAFAVSDFYADSPCVDRAAVLEDNGLALKERIRMISQAKESLILSTFDFRSDEAGKQMLAALYEAARRGVRVQLLVDGFNSRLHMEGNPYFYALAAQPGVEIKIYNPVNPLIPWKCMSRMHDKYVIKDEEVYILGGRNTFNYFLGEQDSYKNYDRDVLVYNAGAQECGKAAQGKEQQESSLYQVKDYFQKIWNQKESKSWHNFATDREKAAKKKGSREAGRKLQELFGNMQKEHPDWFEAPDYEAVSVETNKVTLLSNPTGLYSKRPQVFYALTELMKQAQEEVIIHTPYIMCNEMMYKTFTEVCGGKAKVLLMTNSAENNGNPFGSIDYALNKEKIIKTGLQVLEYEGGVSYHGKSMTIDDDMAVIGSFNMDMKSVYQDTELMLVVNSRELNAQLKENLENYQKDTSPADVQRDDMKALFASDVPLKKRIQRGAIRVLDPLLRFII